MNTDSAKKVDGARPFNSMAVTGEEDSFISTIGNKLDSYEEMAFEGTRNLVDGFSKFERISLWDGTVAQRAVAWTIMAVEVLLMAAVSGVLCMPFMMGPDGSTDAIDEGMKRAAGIPPQMA